MLQIERLIEDSDKNGYASFYAFYSTESSQFTLCGGRVGNEGVFIADAEKLKSEIIDKPRTSYLASNILQFSNPISCLFCCPMTNDGRQNGLREYFKRYFPTIYNKRTNNNSDYPQGIVKTPDKILQFLNSESDQFWESEYRNSIENVNAILVIDMRNNEKNGR